MVPSTARACGSELADIAKTYRHGAPIPRVQYTEAEIATWGAVFQKQEGMLKKFACQEFLDILPLMKKHCGYRVDNIPQVRACIYIMASSEEIICL